MNKKTLSFFKICHQWIGLIGGWFLFVLFISGTLSIFDKEITQWMQPELGLYKATNSISNKALNQAFKSWSEYKNIRKNLIALPSSRDPFIRVVHAQDNMLQGVVIHPQQGNIIPVRATGGGYFIDSLHSNLFIGRFVGGAIVLIVATALILAIITGIIIYIPNMIKNAFLIYSKPKTLRFKSDLHTIIGIFTLPFLFITAISGFLFLAPRYLPNTQHVAKSIFSNRLIPTDQTKQIIKQPDLQILLNKAQAYFSAMPSAIIFTKTDILFIENEQTHIARLKNYIGFNKTTSDISLPNKISSLTLLNKTLLGIHTARTGGVILRAIFAIMGICSIALIILGLLYYSSRKLKNSLSSPPIIKQLFYKVIEGINIGIIMGTPIAILALFWSNRLLPISLTKRIGWETTSFFSVFFLILSITIIISLWNKIHYAWKTLIFILSALCILFPILDCFTIYPYLKAAFVNQNYLYITIDSIIFIFGVIFLKLYFTIRNKGAK